MDDTDKRDSEKKLHTRLRLWQFPDKYILEPIDGFADSYLSISRSDGSINLVGMFLISLFCLFSYLYSGRLLKYCRHKLRAFA